MSELDKKPSHTEKFVDFAFDRCGKDKGLAARLRRAANPDTEYQSWEFLAQWIDLDQPHDRLPFALIASAISSADTSQNGNLKLGQAIALCYEEGRESDAAKTKLRRLLACENIAEVCRVLRPLLSLISSRVSGALDYARLLSQLLRYRYVDGRERVRAEWAQAFYGKPLRTDEQEAA